jgi:aldose 1-epimerase
MKSFPSVNLSGGCSRSILDEKLILTCGRILATDNDSGITGAIESVENTPFDLRDTSSNGKSLGEVVPLINGHGRQGLDHTYLIDSYVNSYEQRQMGGKHPVHHAATLTDEQSGRQLLCSTSMPSVQVYTANWLPGKGDDVANIHVQHNAVCLETQFYPDSPNHPKFPSTILRPGETFEHQAIYSFRTIP